LINGATIALAREERVTYWHVEPESHDVLLAEGLLAESYLDRGNRRGFDNAADGVVALHADWRRQAYGRNFASTVFVAVISAPNFLGWEERISAARRASARRPSSTGRRNTTGFCRPRCSG
jgi:hypothetical protein